MFYSFVSKFCFQAVLDYNNFYMNLTEANAKGNPQWIFEYNPKVIRNKICTYWNYSWLVAYVSTACKVLVCNGITSISYENSQT